MSAYLPKGVKVGVAVLNPEPYSARGKLGEQALPRNREEVIPAPSRWR